MQKIGNITSTADANGEWTNGNVAAGTPPTILDAAWFNTVQRELANVVTGGGLALDSNNDAQVLSALKLLIKGGVTGVIGDARNARMTVVAPSATATFTADELIVGTALGGAQYRIGNFSKTINLSTIGVGGMDTGTAPASGYVAIYAIYNPSTQTSALLALNATAVVAPQVYSGSNMPDGYTASALVSVWRVNSSNLVLGYQVERLINISRENVILTNQGNSSLSPISASGLVPINALDIYGDIYFGSTVASDALLFSISPSLNKVGRRTYRGSSVNFQDFFNISIQTQQMFYYEVSGLTGLGTVAIAISGYKI